MAVALLSACIPAAPAPTSIGGIEISHATVVLSPIDSMPGMDMGSDLAGYMQIKNASGADDRLIGVTSDFADGMLHETTMHGDVASMREVHSIEVPAGTTLEFKHGGLHIMFMNPDQDLQVGDSVTLILEFEKAGKVMVTATVTDQ
jgi:copper(I)-binding protein